MPNCTKCVAKLVKRKNPKQYYCRWCGFTKKILSPNLYINCRRNTNGRSTVHIRNMDQPDQRSLFTTSEPRKVVPDRIHKRRANFNGKASNLF